MEVRIEEGWKRMLQPEFDKPYFSILTSYIKNEYATQTIYPPGNRIFAAFDLCPFNSVKVVILGQDPYHGPGQAHGLCFSVPDGITPPPSLQNIFKEISDDLHQPFPPTGNLERWARQGVLLLNSTLTVRASSPMSHAGKGWEELTDAAIEALSKERNNIVFMLWGSHAQQKARMIDSKKHLILRAPHPSPLSAYRGFFGCRHFSTANNYLMQHGIQGIVW